MRDALAKQLADPGVDIVITTGLISSHEAARIPNLPKPVIASIVADMRLQGFPAERLDDKIVSGRPNLVYIAHGRVMGGDASTVEQTNIDEAIDIFYDAVGFEHLAVMLDELTIEAVPALAGNKVSIVAQRLGVRTSVVAMGDSVEQALSSIPADADAVLVGPLLRLSAESMQALAQGFIDRRPDGVVGAADDDRRRTLGFQHRGQRRRVGRLAGEEDAGGRGARALGSDPDGDGRCEPLELGSAPLASGEVDSLAGLGIAVVNDFKSIEGDRALGLQSLPVVFGSRPAMASRSLRMNSSVTSLA